MKTALPNRWLCGCLLLTVWAATGARAGSKLEVYLNGARLADPSGRRFQNVDVEFGKGGVIRIVTHPKADPGAVTNADSPTIQTTSPTAGARTSEAGPPERALEPPSARPAQADSVSSSVLGRYWLAIHHEGAAAPDLAVDVRLNGQSVGSYTAGETRVIEVTGLLKKGENLAILTFHRKNADGQPLAQDPGVFEVVLAPGTVLVNQDQINLAHPVFSIRREGSQDPGSPEELHFVLPPPERP